MHSLDSSKDITLVNKIFEDMQIPYLRFLKAAQSMVCKIPMRIRDGLLSLYFVILSIYYFLEYSKLLRFVFSSADIKGLFVMLMLILVVIFSITDDPLEEVDFNKPAMGALILFAISIIIVGLIHPLREGWMVFAATLFVMPSFYIVWGNRRNYELLYLKIASVWMKTGIIFYLVSFICLPPDSWHFYLGRYAGITASPNYIGMISVSTIAASLYMLLKEKNILSAIITIGASLMMVWIASSRTAIIADGAIILIGFILIVKKSNPVKLHDPVRVILTLMIAILVGMAFTRMAYVPAESMGYQGIQAVREITDTDEKFTDEELVKAGIIVPGDSVDAGVSWLRFLIQTAYAEDAVNEADSNAAEAASSSGSLTNHGSGSDLSNGRIEIYSQVIRQINLIGHDPLENPLYFNNPVVGLQEVKGAHNTPLDFTYVCGIISGLLCLAIEIIAAVFVLKYVFSRKQPSGNAFAAMIITGYGIESMLDIQVIMGNRALVTLFFLAFSMIAIKSEEVRR